MGGKYESDLDPCVTHLVATGWGSQKCLIASKAQLPIVTLDWVRESFKRSLKEEEERFALPPLQGLIVAVSDLEPAPRAKAEKAITRAGGRYTKEFSRKNTHLICPEKLEKETAKYRAAVDRGCKVVSLRWLDACVRRRACQDETRYQVKITSTGEEGGARRQQEEGSASLKKREEPAPKAGTATSSAGGGGGGGSALRRVGSIFDELGLFEPPPTSRRNKKPKLAQAPGGRPFVALHDVVVEETMAGFPSSEPSRGGALQTLQSQRVNAGGGSEGERSRSGGEWSRGEASCSGIDSEGELPGGSQGSRAASDFGFGAMAAFGAMDSDDEDGGITFC